MVTLAESFLSPAGLTGRLLFVVLLYAGLGLFLLPFYVQPARLTNRETGRSNLLLALPLGWFSLHVVAFLYFRLAQLLKLEPSLDTILVLTLLTQLCAIALLYRSAGPRQSLGALLRGLRTLRIELLTALIATLAVACLCILPLLIDSHVVFYGGYGTDTFTYTRTPRSIAHNMYLQPAPPPTDDQMLRHPARTYVSGEIASESRPGSFLYAAVTAKLGFVNEFQAYWLSACMMLVVMFHYICFLVADAAGRSRWKRALCFLTILLMPALGVTGNLNHEYFAHCLAVVCIISVGGVLACVSRFHEDRWLFQAALVFAFVVLTDMAYDFRHGLVAAACLCATAGIQWFTKYGLTRVMARNMLAMAGGVVVGLLYATPMAHLRHPAAPRLFPADPFSLQRFVHDAALSTISDFRVPLILILIAGIISIGRWKHLWTRTQELPAARTGLIYLAVVLAASLGMCTALQVVENHWAAMKVLYLVLPAAILMTLLSLSIELSSRQNRPPFIPFCVSLCLIAIAGLSWPSHISVARSIVRDDMGLIRTDGVLSAIRAFRPERVKRIVIQTSDLQRYLIYISLLDDVGLPIDTNFFLWRNGGGARYPLATLTNYRRVVDRAAMDKLLPAFCFSDTPRCAGSSLMESSQGFYGEVNEAPPAVDEYHLELTLPKGAGGPNEPLLACGDPGNAGLVFVRYLSPTAIQLGLDYWGRPSVLSEPLARPASGRIELGIQLNYAENAVEAFANGRTILREEIPPGCSGRDKLVFGENRIGATTASRAFSGVLKIVPR